MNSAPGDSLLLETAFENNGSLMAVLDREFRFVRVNRAYAAVNDRDPSWFPGRAHFELHPSGENEKIFRLAMESGETLRTRARPLGDTGNPEPGGAVWTSRRGTT